MITARCGRGVAVGAGEVVVVGLGPGAEGWLTPQARDELERAEHLVGYRTYLDRVRTRPGQQRHASGNTVEADRADHALSLAAARCPGCGRLVRRSRCVRHGRGCRRAGGRPRWSGRAPRIVPGLTAAQAVASRVGAPLGHDYAVVSLSDRLKPWAVIEQRLDALAAADLAIAIYNPASQSRTWQVESARTVLLRHRDPATPVVVGRDVGGPQESVRVVTLGDLDPATIDMRCLLIIGSSTTRVMERPGVNGDGGQSLVLTPRHYPSC